MAPQKYLPGEFCWTDLGTTDVPAAKKFYKAVLGWSTTDYPMGGGMNYSMLRVGKQDAGALYPMMPEQKKMKAPPFWLAYVAVKSVDASFKKAKAAGAKVIAPPMDVMDVGRQAILADPTGSVFSIWQAKKHPGAAREDKPGFMCWHDLNTPDPKKAGAFYAKVFGWKVKTLNMGPGPYHVLKLGKKDAGGIWPMMLTGMGPGWLTYWQVVDCAKTVAKAKKLKGEAMMNPMPVPGMGFFAVLKDPQGAVFGIFEFKK